MFREIYSMIVDDNHESGVKPAYLYPSPSSSPERDGEISRRSTPRRPLSLPDGPNSAHDEYHELSINQRQSTAADQEGSRVTTLVRKRRPQVLPKPEALRGRSRSPNELSSASSPDTLAERFAQLRSPPVIVPPKQQQRNLQKVGRAEGLDEEYEGQSSKLSGPRGMPPPPPKIPLDDDTPVMLPRAPSPTYSPLRSTHIPPDMSPLRGNSRNVLTSNVRNSQYSSNASSESRETNGTPRSPTSSVTSFRTNPRSIDISCTTSISARGLYDILRSSNVLLIDIRNRGDFDQGHIHARSIMCIQPLELRSGVSAEDLEDRLILSPPAEQALFEHRNEFDLVVYYDQNTRSDRFLRGSPDETDAPAMRALYDTIYEFNYYKQLRRPPVVLLGGLDAWIDLFGPQALQASKSFSTTNTNGSHKPDRPISRVPMRSSNSQLEVRKRRLRDHNPLGPEEERVWLEKAHKEEVDEAEYQNAQSDGEVESPNSITPTPVSNYYHSLEEFYRKFPEAPARQQSMSVSSPPPPSRQPPSIPIPSRPPPAIARPSYSGVSDRQSSQLSPSSSRQPSAAQPPLYTSRAISSYLKLPRTGLINFSVTCYMNATIQCLLATIPLSQFFLDNRWRDYTQKNWKGSNGILPEIYANLIRSLWRNDVQAVRPSSFRKFCARLNGEWGVDRQQDAKEFFDFLLDCLHEDLNVAWERSPLRPLTTEQELLRERMPVSKVSKIEWDRYTHRESSFISDLFAGQHASRLRCTTCQNTSTTYEAFYSISVEIPRSGRGCDIQDCLRSYCQEEMLSGDEVWKCPYCKCEREATKQITITRAPQFLVVHFKRFSASKTESARKVHTPIHFPLHGLDLEPYMIPPSKKIDSDAMTDGERMDQATTPPYVYDAYAVMRHLGQSGSGGHYIALVRDAARGCWRKFDDDRVTDFDPGKLRSEHKLQNEQAYLVFYGRSSAR